MTASSTNRPAEASGTFALGGDLAVYRLGYGSMQLTGPGYWGQPSDRDGAIAVLRRAVDLGVNLIDTADAYGPAVVEQLIHDALHPYSEGLVIATKCGLTRSGPRDWRPVGRPEYLRQQVEMSLRNLGVERIGLQQLHRVDPQIPIEDQVGELALLRDEGKIQHIGLSEVSIEQLLAAQRVTTIASVQNLFNLADRAAEPLLDQTTEQHIAFIPWWPLATGNLVSEGSVLDRLSRDRHASPSQLALAWLLRRSPVILPIPGTTSVAHLEDNVRAAQVQLTDEEFNQLTGAVYPAVARPTGRSTS